MTVESNELDQDLFHIVRIRDRLMLSWDFRWTPFIVGAGLFTKEEADDINLNRLKDAVVILPDHVSIYV